MRRVVALIALVFLVAGFGSCSGSSTRARRSVTSSAEHAWTTEHGLWVTRWDYKTEDDVRAAIANAESIGITDIYWQVRGQGDAFYRSDLEPWGEEIAGPNGVGPGFDPLKVAVQESRVRGIRIHAWINVMPLWKGKAMPRSAAHPWNAHPSWRLQDANGSAQALGNHYVIANPTNPQWRRHVVRVVGDIADRYRIDGVHLDYIRFLTDEVGSGLWPGDAATRRAYAKDTRKSADPGSINSASYRDWIRGQITELVGEIKREAKQKRFGIRVSAAVWRNPDIANDRYLQDAAAWVEQGLVDTVMPMIYTDDDSAYRSDLAAWYREVPRERVVPGIGVYKHNEVSQTLGQISIGHPRKYAVFAYSSVFESPNPGQAGDAAARSHRASLRRSLETLSTRIGSAP